MSIKTIQKCDQCGKERDLHRKMIERSADIEIARAWGGWSALREVGDLCRDCVSEILNNKQE